MPPVDFEAAVARIRAIQRSEEGQPGLRYPAQALLHPQPAERALVFLHGFTNSPEQFRPLGERFFELGCNVWIPRMPQHGLADRTGRDLRAFSLAEYLQSCQQAVDIGGALGRKLTLVGLSGGGNAAIYLAQTRSDIDLAVVIAPFIGVRFIPAWLTRPAAALLSLLPDTLVWWDGKTRNDNPESPDFAYTAFTSRSIGQVLRLGQQAKRLARQGPPAARRVLIVTNQGDEGVNQTEIDQLVAGWKGYAGLTIYQIPLDEQLPHDFISLGLHAARNAAYYPRLIDLILSLSG